MTFTVVGLPQPAGSKRGFPFKRKDGRIGVAMTDDNPKSRSWKREVAVAAAQARREMASRGTWTATGVLGGPVRLEVSFYLPRPKGHFGTGRNASTVKPGAPAAPAVKPDLLKLARAIEDALTGVLWRDDAQIVSERLEKRYAVDGVAVTEIRVTEAA